jgi:hypothetical protein
MGYFERPVIFAILVASFALVFLPLTTLSLIPNYVEWLPYAVLAVGVGLGVDGAQAFQALNLTVECSRNMPTGAGADEQGAGNGRAAQHRMRQAAARVAGEGHSSFG